MFSCYNLLTLPFPGAPTVTHLVSAEKVPSQSTQLMCCPLRKHRNHCMRNTFLSSSCISLLVNYCQSTHFGSHCTRAPFNGGISNMVSPVKLHEKQYKGINMAQGSNVHGSLSRPLCCLFGFGVYIFPCPPGFIEVII